MGAGNPLLRNHETDVITYFIDWVDYYKIVTGESDEITDDFPIETLQEQVANLYPKSKMKHEWKEEFASAFRTSALIIAEIEHYYLILCPNEIHNVGITMIPNVSIDELEDDLSNFISNYESEYAGITAVDNLETIDFAEKIYRTMQQDADTMMLYLLAYIFHNEFNGDERLFNRVVSVRSGAWTLSSLGDTAMDFIKSVKKEVLD